MMKALNRDENYYEKYEFIVLIMKNVNNVKFTHLLFFKISYLWDGYNFRHGLIEAKW